MPRYEYVCDTQDCGGNLQVICKVSEKPEFVKCPICGCIMDQDLSGRAAVFKGQGWTPTFSPIGRKTKNG